MTKWNHCWISETKTALLQYMWDLNSPQLWICNLPSEERIQGKKKLPSRWNLSQVAKVTLMWKIFLNWKSLESHWRKRFHQIHVCFHPAISWVIHCVHLLWISNDQHETNTLLKRRAALLHDAWSMIKTFPKALRTRALITLTSCFGLVCWV